MFESNRKSVGAGLGAVALAATLCGVMPPAVAQTGAPAVQAQAGAPKQSGTVKSAGDSSLVITNKDGQDVSVSVSASTKILIVPPGSTNLSAASAGTTADIQTGDRALVTGTAGDSATSVHAVRVIVMKSTALAQVHAAQSSAWAQGTGGIVKSVAADKIVVASGMKTESIAVTPHTIVRRYAAGSVKFEDAQVSAVSAIQPGDQLRVRGTKSEDGLSVTADEIVTGSFANYSGTIASIDSSTSAIALKDLVSKKTVTVAITPGTDVRRLPAQMATMIAMRMKGSGAANGAAGAGATPSAAKPASAPASSEAQGASGAGGEAGQRRASTAGGDLSRMLARLPAETLGGLKPGEAVMIVASPSPGDPTKSTAITLLVGVEAILAAPAGEATTLSPWNMSGTEGAAGMGGATP